MLAEISGKLRYDTEELAQYPAVGDCVMVDIQPELAVIHRVLTRKSLFVRKAVGVSGQAQPVADNVDIAFLCMSLNQNFSLNRMERYLSIAWANLKCNMMVAAVCRHSVRIKIFGCQH